MYRIVFLVLLLWIDWEMDTSFGTSPVSKPLSSTEAACASLSFKHQLVVRIQSLHMKVEASLSDSLSPPPQHPIPAYSSEASLSSFLGDGLLYMLQSIQC
jgi:hypothetical protein